jgi:meso-butanediol dehydrogenase / (S,S)-butanediol dehydrogenase / diacetyl reductase
VTSLVPARRPTSADEVAAVVAWPLSDAASYVNGAVIPVDGAGMAVDVGTRPYDPECGCGAIRRREHGRSSAASARLQRWRPA